MTTRERREARAERLREWADKREAKAEALDKKAHDMAAMIPLGQPMMPGHHSYSADRNHRDRIHATAERAYENADKARSMAAKAANIEAATDASIFDDDPDAIEALEARIARAEAERGGSKRTTPRAAGAPPTRRYWTPGSAMICGCAPRSAISASPASSPPTTCPTWREGSAATASGWNG